MSRGTGTKSNTDNGTTDQMSGSPRKERDNGRPSGEEYDNRNASRAMGSVWPPISGPSEAGDITSQ